MKIINDTLKGPNGKYSRKSLTAFVSFVVSILYGVVLDFLSSVYEWSFTPKEYVFFGFLGLAGGAITLTVMDKLKKYGGGDEQ